MNNIVDTFRQLIDDAIISRNLKPQDAATMVAEMTMSKYSMNELAALLDANDADIQCCGAKALAYKRDPAAAALLVPLLRNENPEVRDAVGYALGHLNNRGVIPAIIQMLTNQNESVDCKRGCAQALGYFSASEAAKDLAEVLTQDVDKELKLEVLRALGRIRESRILHNLLPFLQDPDPEIRRQTIFTMGQIRHACVVDDLCDMVHDPDVTVRKLVAVALGMIGHRDGEKGLDTLLKDENHVVRAAAINALSALECFGWELTVAAMANDPAPQVREQVAVSLGNADSATNDHVKPLIALSGDLDNKVRYAAISAMHSRWNPKFAKPSINALQDTDINIISGAATALGRSGLSTALVPLCELLRHDEPEIRSIGALALGELGNLQAIPELQKALSDPDPGVRQSIAEALGQIGHESVVPILIDVLNDNSEEVRVRKEAASSLGMLEDDRAVIPLIGLLNNSQDPDLVEAVVWALESIGDDRSVEPLGHLLQSTTNFSVARAARSALECIGGERAEEILQSCTNGAN